MKYHENLRTGKEKLKNERKKCLQAIATAMNCFVSVTDPALYTSSFHQIWRDNLLMGSLLKRGNNKDGAFVFLSPVGNAYCKRAVSAYQQLLTTEQYFYSWSIESVVHELQNHVDQPWIAAFHNRYLKFAKLNALLGESTISS